MARFGNFVGRELVSSSVECISVQTNVARDAIRAATAISQYINPVKQYCSEPVVCDHYILAVSHQPAAVVAAPKYPERTEKQQVDWYMGQGGHKRQGIRAYVRSEVWFRRRTNNQYGKQDRAYWRLDKRRSGLAFGSPAIRRCAAGTRRTLYI